MTPAEKRKRYILLKYKIAAIVRRTIKSKDGEIIQGERKSSDIAKIVNKKLGGKLDLDEIIRALPPGNCELKRDRSKK